MAELSEEKEKALKVAVNQIERQHGKGAIMRLGADGARVKAEAIPTGAINLDQATGIGGVPRGRITEIYGPEGSGKTTLTLHVIANAQKQGGVAAFVDAEHALDVSYAEKLGVDTENLLVSQPDTGEQALEIAEVLVRSGALDVVVVDSVAALVPRAEIEGEMGDSHVGLQARLMSQAMRKLTGAIGRSDTALVFTNQIREKIGVMFGCFQYDTRVTLADGSSEKIGKIVNQELPVEVLSYDPETGRVEPRKVVNWYDNGRADHFLQFEVEGGPSGRRHFAATENHTVFTPDGPRPAGELAPGDEVLVTVEDSEGKDRIPGSAPGSPDDEWGSSFSSPQAGGGVGLLNRAGSGRRVVTSAKILDRYVKPPTRSMQRFDLEVEGNHTYLVDGVVVHNSPETTSGGRALKFYASLRLDIRRVASIKEGNEQVGSRTRVKVVKNKCLAAGTRVFDPATGETHTIEEIVRDGKGATVAAAGEDGSLRRRHILQRFDQGEAEVIGLRLQDGTELWLTPDHRVLTDTGWREAGELGDEDRVARPRRAFGFGDEEPIPEEHARLLGYLIGDGYVGGKTPVTFVNTNEELREDVRLIVDSLGCDVDLRGHGYDLAISHRPGEENGVIQLCRWAGIYGCLAWEKRIPEELFSPEISPAVLGNLILGIWESDGYVSREQSGGFRLGFTTTSEELARQLHWLLLRWGIGSSVRAYDPRQKRPSVVDGRRIQHRRACWEVRISGIDNVRRFAEEIPTWGPKGRVLSQYLEDTDLATHRGSQRNYLRRNQAEAVLSSLRAQDVSPAMASSLSGWNGDPSGGLRQVVGVSRPRRDRVEALASALDSDALREVVAEELWYDRIVEVLPARTDRVYDIHVAADHNLMANDVVVSNCAPPFKQAEFDIMFNEGISKEGLLVDLGEEHGVVSRAGAWYSYGEDDDLKLGQGKENAKQFLKENPDIAREIETRVKREMGLLEEDEEGAASEDAEVDGEDSDDDGE